MLVECSLNWYFLFILRLLVSPPQARVEWSEKLPLTRLFFKDRAFRPLGAHVPRIDMPDRVILEESVCIGLKPAQAALALPELGSMDFIIARYRISQESTYLCPKSKYRNVRAVMTFISFIDNCFPIQSCCPFSNAPKPPDPYPRRSLSHLANDRAHDHVGCSQIPRLHCITGCITQTR